MTAGEFFAANIVPPRSAVERRIAHLSWRDEAGGFNFSRKDILSMSLDEMDRYIAIANERRKARNEAVKKANTPAKRKRAL